jgi:hypothetical protein
VKRYPAGRPIGEAAADQVVPRAGVRLRESPAAGGGLPAPPGGGRCCCGLQEGTGWGMLVRGPGSWDPFHVKQTQPEGCLAPREGLFHVKRPPLRLPAGPFHVKPVPIPPLQTGGMMNSAKLASPVGEVRRVPPAGWPPQEFAQPPDRPDRPGLPNRQSEGRFHVKRCPGLPLRPIPPGETAAREPPPSSRWPAEASRCTWSTTPTRHTRPPQSIAGCLPVGSIRPPDRPLP